MLLASIRIGQCSRRLPRPRLTPKGCTLSRFRNPLTCVALWFVAAEVPQYGTLHGMGTATTYYNLIDGDWVPSVSGDVFENRNPANSDDLVGLFQRSTAADAARAIDAA